MALKGLKIVDAKELSVRQLKQLKQRTIEYAPLQDRHSPFKINLQNGRNQWFCAVYRGNVIGFSRIGINHEKKLITSQHSYVMPEHQRKGIRTAMLVRQIGLARGLGRYSIKLDWLDPSTGLKMMKKFGLILEEHAQRRKGRGRIKAGLNAHDFPQREKNYLKKDYGNKESFKKGLENCQSIWPGDPVLRNPNSKDSRTQGTISDGWIQLMPRTKKRRPSGPKHFGKTLFTPKPPKGRTWVKRKPKPK